MHHYTTLADILPVIEKKSWQGSVISYQQNKRVCLTDQLANLEKYKAIFEGLANGDRVLLKITSSIESVLAIISIWYAGGVVIPIQANDNTININKLIKNSNTHYLFDPLSCDLEKFTVVENELFQLQRKRSVASSDVALIIYTSGSTAAPKGIMLTHNNVITSLYSIINYLELSYTDKILCMLPLTFDYGLYQLLFAFACNSQVIIYPGLEKPLEIIKILKNENISVFPVVPSIAHSIMSLCASFNIQLPALKKITNTGGHIPTKIVEQITSLFPQVQLYLMYGLTECKRVFYLPPKDLQRKKDSVGIPIPGIAVGLFAVDNKQGQPIYQQVDVGEVGELFVKTTAIMQEYYRMDSNADIIAGKYREDNWLATGDLFSMDAEGYFYFSGRRKELIKQNGYCIFPKFLEVSALKHPKVEAACILAQLDNNQVEYAALYIEPLNYDPTETTEFMQLWLQQQGIEHNSLPKKIIIVESMPLNDNMKIDKKALATVS